MDFQGWDDGGWFEFFTRVTLPPLWIADQVRNELAPRSYPAGTQRGVSPAGGFWMESGMTVALPYPVDSRLRGNDEDGRGNDGMFCKGIHEWRGGRCCVSFSPSAPVSGTGTGFVPLPSWRPLQNSDV